MTRICVNCHEVAQPCTACKGELGETIYHDHFYRSEWWCDHNWENLPDDEKDGAELHDCIDVEDDDPRIVRTTGG